MDNSPPNGERRSKHRIIVKFAKFVRESQASLESHCNQICNEIPEVHLVRPPSKSGRAVFDVDASISLKKLSDRISESDSVDYAEPDETDSAT